MGVSTPVRSNVTVSPPRRGRLRAWLSEGQGNEGLFRSIIAIAIALVSMAGAVAAWQATVVGDEAAARDGQGIQEQTQQVEREGVLQAQVDEDLRTLAQYRAHIKAWRLLETDAAAAGDAALAGSLYAQAQGELALARTLQNLFRAYVPDLGDANGNVPYDATGTRARLLRNDVQRNRFRLEASQDFRKAELGHSKAVWLVFVVAVFVGSLFFLTLGQLLGRRYRLIFFSAGCAFAIAAVVIWPLKG